jgi:hypothetical protein
MQPRWQKQFAEIAPALLAGRNAISETFETTAQGRFALRTLRLLCEQLAKSRRVFAAACRQAQLLPAISFP